MNTVLIIVLTLVGTASFSKTDGSANSLDQAFKDLFKSDGHSAEEMDVKIGKAINTETENFLKALKKYEKKIKRLDALVGNFGEEFVDQFQKQKSEAEKRIKNLTKAKAKTNDPEIKRLAEKCIKQLKAHLDQIDRGISISK